MKNLLLIVLSITCIGCTAQRGSFSTITEKNGKIGIGTNSPDELLTVKGVIHAQEVLVDMKGAMAPDFVFESYFNGNSLLKPDYKLPSLSEVEAFVKKNHHLPKVPSAKIIEKEGLSLKEMNLLLLEKIEELTLYAIEQQHQIEVLQKEVQGLKH